MKSKSKTTASLEELLAQYKNCTDSKKKRMLHISIVENTMELVKSIAISISMQSGISHEDLIQVGSLGLIKAIEFYKPDMNTKFTTYAIYFIKGEIRHYLRDKASLIKTPREVQELLLKINTAKKKLAETGFIEPSNEQIAEFLNVPVEKIVEVCNIDICRNTLSLDQSIISDNEESSLLDKIPSEDYQEFQNSHENKIMLAETIEKLPPELKEVIKLSFYKDLNQREISEIMNMSQMQVSRRLKKALNKMYELIKHHEN
ncbi:MAG: sigma-70 family RNA polymerase sigma factor [Brachyspira sp.]|nr:sigma-70 family RNA polymerase sigma factor [Brachyspira sp.]